jgi:hypothetical protein
VSTKQVTVAGIETTPDLPSATGADHDHVNAAVAETLREATKDKPRVDFPTPSKQIAYGNGQPVANPGAPPPSAPPPSAPPGR